MCTVAPLLYFLSDLLPPPPFPMYSIYRQCVTVGGGWGVLNCAVDHIQQEFYTLFLTRFRIYKIVSPPLTKMTSKDDIKGLVVLRFLHPCCSPSSKSFLQLRLAVQHILLTVQQIRPLVKLLLAVQHILHTVQCTATIACRTV